MSNKKVWICDCGSTQVHFIDSTTVDITGKGWLRGQQKTEIVCKDCGDAKRIGYEVLWRGENPSKGISITKKRKKSGKKPTRKSTSKTDTWSFVE